MTPRHRPQFRIAGAIGLIFVTALGLAALKIANDEWAGGITSLSLFLLAAAWLGVLFARGPARAFWTGFALMGGLYLALIHVPVLYITFGEHLLAPRLSNWLDAQIHPAPPAPTGFQSVLLMRGGFGGPTSTLESLTPFARITLALESLLWAFAGGLFARRAAVSSARTPTHEPATLPANAPASPSPSPSPPEPISPAPPPPPSGVRLGSVSKLPPSSA